MQLCQEKRLKSIISLSRYYMHVVHISKIIREYVWNEKESCDCPSAPTSLPQRPSPLPFSCLAFQTVVHRNSKFHKNICEGSLGGQIHILL